MSIKRLLFLIYFLISPLSLSAHPLAQISLLPKGQKTAPLPAPDPLNLEPNWWNFFENVETLSPKIEEQEKKLLQIENSLEASERASMGNLVQRYLVTLEALAQLHKQPSEVVLQKPRPAKYQVSELLEILATLRDFQLKAKSSKEDLNQNKHSLEAAKAHLDHLALDYVKLKEAAQAKLLLGLEIMGTKAGAVLLEKRLKNDESKYSALTAQIEALQKQLEEGRDKLDFSTFNWQDADSEIEAAKKEIEKGEMSASLADSKLIAFYAQATEENSAYEQLLQGATQAKVAEAILRANLLLLENQKLLALLSLESEKTSLSLLKETLSRWKSSLQKIRENQVIWQNSSQKGRNKAQESLLKEAQTQDELQSRSAKELSKTIKKTIATTDATLRDLQKLGLICDQAEFLAEAVEKRFYARESTISQLALKTVSLFFDFWRSLWGYLHTTLFRVNDLPISILDLLRAIIILVIAYYGSLIVQAAIKKIGYQQRNIALSTFYTLGRLAHYTILLIGVFISLSTIGLSFTNLAIVAGALSLGIGFGLQSIVNNFLSGLIILFERNLKVGDFLELESGHLGRVLEINVRSTIIHTNDGIDIVVPNSDIIGSKVFNWTMTDPFRSIRVPFSVSYNSDKELIKKIVLEVADSIPFTLKGLGKYAPPKVVLIDFRDSALHFELLVWVDEKASRTLLTTRAAYLWEIHSQLSKNGIEIFLRPQEIILRSLLKEPQ